MSARIPALLIGLLFAVTAAAQQRIPAPDPPAIGAPSYILIDADSLAVLAEGNPHEPRPPASLVKMMTAYVVFSELEAGNIALGEEVTISEKAWRATGSRMFIEVDTRVSVEELLQGMIIQSGNDASIALAEHVAGDEATFARVMNSYAEELGMSHTHYTNATGLPDPEQVTTAYDTALLGRSLARDFPDYYAWYSERSFTYGGIRQHNRNRLLWRDESVDGIKTGHTRAAGYNLATSAERDGMRLVSVVLGDDNPQARVEHSRSLLNYGFRFFRTERLYAAGEPITEARAWKGSTDAVSLGVAEDIYVTVPRRDVDFLRARIEMNGDVVAPVSQGEPLGRLIVELDGEELREVPLVALGDVEEGALWRRLMDDLIMRFQ